MEECEKTKIELEKERIELDRKRLKIDEERVIVDLKKEGNRSKEMEMMRDMYFASRKN